MLNIKQLIVSFNYIKPDLKVVNYNKICINGNISTFSSLETQNYSNSDVNDFFYR